MRHQTTKILPAIFLLLLGISASTAWAQPPQETLNQYVSDLQKSPDDDALRERIIRLAQTMQPAPVAPAEATEHEGAAEYAFRNAKSEADFADAAREYEKALLAAPWLAADYFNCGVAYEKAKHPEAAVRYFNLYLIAAPDAKDAKDVRKRIGGLKYAAEKAARDAQAAADKDAGEKRRQRATREVLDRLKVIAGGAVYDRLTANATNPNVQGNFGTGVNDQEYRGSTWWGWGDSCERYVFEDGRVLVCFVSDEGVVNKERPDLIGTPSGPTIRDIVWEHPDYNDQTRIKRVWASVNEETGSITWSEDRPVDDADYNPDVRYKYWLYKRH